MEKEKVNYKQIKKNVADTLAHELTELDVYIMKCHLFVEKEMISFLEYKGTQKLKKSFQFNLYQRIVSEVFDGFHVGGFSKREDIEAFIDVLAELRNGIAHKFHFQKGKLDKAITLANKVTRGLIEVIDKPKVGMFDNALTTISIVLILKSGRDVYAKREESKVEKNLG